MALNNINMDIGRVANLRVRLTNHDVSATGMTWHLNRWGDGEFNSTEASFIAFEND